MFQPCCPRCRWFRIAAATAAACASLSVSTALAVEPLVVPLWKAGAPGFENRKDEPEVVKPRREGDTATFPVTTNIHNPSLLAYLPDPAVATGAAIIIAPGGGHMFLTMGREGRDVAEWLRSIGVAAFVLKYRLARAESSPYSLAHAEEDGLRAVRVVRSRAAEWKIDPSRIGMMAFSAGGRPAMAAAFASGAPGVDASDPVERASARPDFLMLIYSEMPRGEYSVTAAMPPAFIICAFDDTPKVSRLTELVLKMKAVEVPAELHVYQRGGHGYGYADRPYPVAHWPARLQEWLTDTGFSRGPALPVLK